MSVEQLRNELHRLNAQYKQVLLERSRARVPAQLEHFTQQLEEIDSKIAKLCELLNEAV